MILNIINLYRIRVYTIVIMTLINYSLNPYPLYTKQYKRMKIYIEDIGE